MGYDDPTAFEDEAQSELLRLRQTLQEFHELISQSLEFLKNHEPHQLPAPPKFDNGPVKYVNLDAPRRM